MILLAGLQGSGKTTTAAKLAKHLKEGRGEACSFPDVYRPAAIEQLGTLARQVGVDFLPSRAGEKPLSIARCARPCEKALQRRADHDTAGRLAVDEPMMKGSRTCTPPVETLFVADSMQGQDAVNVARAFGETLALTGVVLTARR